MLLVFCCCINCGPFLRLGQPTLRSESGGKSRLRSGAGLLSPETSFALHHKLISSVPGLIYAICPAVLLYLSSRIVRVPPQGSVMLEAGRVGKIAMAKRSWDAAKPSTSSRSRAHYRRRG